MRVADVAVEYEERYWYPDDGTIVWGDVLQSAQVAPGSELVLRRDTGNEHDANAVAVELPGGAQVGFVPREVAARRRAAVVGGRPA